MNANTLITQLNTPAVLLKINQRLAAVVSLLLLVACVYLLVEVTWLFFPQEDGVTVSARPVKVQSSSKKVQQNNFRKLTQMNVFGVGQNKAAPVQTIVPITKLNLTLKGVLAATPMKLASAIIAQGKGKEDIYSVGDKMSGGVLIKEIHPEHVVLERSGKQEILKLQKIRGVDLKGKSAGSGKSLNSHSPRTNSAALTKIRKNIMKNPASFADYALPKVVKENGSQIGYRLDPQKKGELLFELGLLPGDVIIEINGTKLDQAKNGVSALRSLSTAKNINIVVKRNGVEVPLGITLQDNAYSDTHN